MSNPLETRCETCGTLGNVLSHCQKCGEFLTITLGLPEDNLCKHESGQRFLRYDADGCGYYLWQCDDCDYSEIDQMP